VHRNQLKPTLSRLLHLMMKKAQVRVGLTNGNGHAYTPPPAIPYNQPQA
jgi:hypothetical protein